MFLGDTEATPDSSPQITTRSTPNSVTSNLLFLEFWFLVDELEIRFGSGLLNFYEFEFLSLLRLTDILVYLFMYDMARRSSAEGI
jgi:hypothetical protein